MQKNITSNYANEIALRDTLLKDKNNIFVKAGAGAGKSTSLVSRIIGFLAEDDSPKDFVVITFTNKAAEELRQKIINRLNSSIKEENDSRKKSKLIAALNQIDLMHISTIHKFCGDILRENSIYAGLSPNFKILEDSDDKKRQSLFLNQKLKTLTRADFISLDVFDEPKSTIKNRIEKAFKKLLSFVDKIELNNIYNINADNSPLVYGPLKSYFKWYLDYIYDEYIKYYSGTNTTFKDLLKKEYADLGLGDYSGDVSVFSDADIRKFIKRFLKDSGGAPFNKNKFKPKANSQDNKIIMEKIVSDLASESSKNSPVFDALVMKQTALIYKKAHIFYLEYLEFIKKDIDNISNNQSISLTKELLYNPNLKVDIVGKLKKQYKHIYIDEYQDTDHTQRDIAFALTRSNNDFLDNALYVVGDPKQSIYRFRGAEPEVYFDTENYFRANNTKIYDLNINFRSNSKILEYVNDTFKNIDLLGNNSAYQDMLCASQNVIDDKDYNNSNNLIGVYKYQGINPESISKLIQKIKKDYKIRRLYEEKDAQDNTYYYSKYEDVQFKDFMVLMQEHKKMSAYVSEFTKNGIPSRVSGESNFRIVEAIRAFVNLYESITTKSEKTFEMAASVIRTVFSSKFVNLTYEKEKEKINSLLAELKDITKDMSAYGKAIYLANHLEWIIEENSEIKGFIMNSISSKLNQMIEDIFSKNYSNGNDLSQAFRTYIDDVIEYESLNDDDADCVHIINSHKAKGLEAKIVIWVSVDKPHDFSTMFKDGYLYVRDDDLDLVDETKSASLQLADDLEKTRLEYVAVTRAGEAFILTYDTNKSGISCKGLFYREGFTYLSDIKRSIVYDLPENNGDGINSSKYDSKDTIFNNTPSLSITSPSGTEKASPTRTREAKKGIQKANDDRPSNNVIGTIMHKAFELLVKDDKHDVDRQVNKAITSNKDFVSDVDKLKDFIFVCTKELDKYYKDNKIYDLTLKPELKFSYKKSDDVISNGSIDLLVIDKDNNITIIDYKSDDAYYITDEDLFKVTLKEKYETQLNAYEESIKDLGLSYKTIKKKIIYFRNYDRANKKVDLMTYEL